MKTSIELEQARKELFNPPIIILESVMNFHPGQIVGRNPTNHDYNESSCAIRGLRSRGKVTSVVNVLKKDASGKSVSKIVVRVRWDSGQIGSYEPSKLKIY